MLIRNLTLIAVIPVVAACTAPPVAVSAASAPVPEAKTASNQEMCTAIRRGGRGDAQDTRIAEHWPTRNYGTAPAAFAGNVSGGARHALIGFDLSSLPSDASITSATLRLHKGMCGGGGVMAHQVTRAWDENTVTWNSFESAYERVAFSTLPAESRHRTSLDLTELAQKWIEGSAENNGILLAQESANTTFSTSEAEDPDDRPTLEICWSSQRADVETDVF